MLDGADIAIRFWWRASIQSLFPLSLLAILELSRLSVPASVKCWIYRGVFLKVLLIFLFPVSLILPVLPRETSEAESGTTIVQPAAAESAIPVVMNQLTTDVGALEAASQNVLSSYSWIHFLFFVLFAGTVFMTWRTIVEYRLARHYARLGTPNVDTDVTRMLRNLCVRMNVARAPELRLTATHVGPMLVGVIRPVILVPRWLLTSSVDFKLAVAHELAHVRRRDLVWNFLIRAVQVVYIGHPLVWWLARRYNVAVEIACDQAALRNTGESRRVYGELLLQSVQSDRSATRGPSLSLALAPFTCLKERLMAIRTGNVDQRCSLLVMVGALAVVCVPPVTLAQSPNYENRYSNTDSATARASSESSVFSQGSASGGGGGRAGGSSSGSAGGFARSSAESSGGGVASGEANGSAASNHASGKVSAKASADSRKNKNDRVAAKKSRVPLFDKSGIRTEVRWNSDNGPATTQSSRSVAVHDGETLIEISDTPDSVRVKVTKTEDDGEKITFYTAKTVEELKRASPAGYELYEKYLLDDVTPVKLDQDDDSEPAGDAKKGVRGNEAADDRKLKFKGFQLPVKQNQEKMEQQARQFEETIKAQRRMIEKERQELQERVQEKHENLERIHREILEKIRKLEVSSASRTDVSS